MRTQRSPPSRTRSCREPRQIMIDGLICVCVGDFCMLIIAVTFARYSCTELGPNLGLLLITALVAGPVLTLFGIVYVFVGYDQYAQPQGTALRTILWVRKPPYPAHPSHFARDSDSRSPLIHPQSTTFISPLLKQANTSFPQVTLAMAILSLFALVALAVVPR